METRKPKKDKKQIGATHNPGTNLNKPIATKTSTIRKKIVPIPAKLISSSLPSSAFQLSEESPTPTFFVSPLIQPRVLLDSEDTSWHEEKQAVDFWGVVTMKIPESPTKIEEEKEKELSRTPKHVWFNLDKSGSMEGNKLTLAKKAIVELIANDSFLNDSDRVTIYAFDNENTTICEYVEVAEFRNKQSSARILFESLKASNGTFIGSGFETFSTSKKINAIPKKDVEQFRLVVITMTDGNCNFPDKSKLVVDEFKEKHPDIISYGIGFGEDYTPKAVQSLNHNVELSAPIHIQDENDISHKFEFIGESIKQVVSIPVSLSLTFNGETIPLPEIKRVKAGEEYSCFFRIKKELHQHTQTLTIDCQYLDSSETKLQYLAPAITNSQCNHELLNLYINIRAQEILELTHNQTKLYSDISKLRVSPLNPSESFKKYTAAHQAMGVVYSYIVELRKLYDLLANQPDEISTHSLNGVLDLLSYLTSLYLDPLKKYSTYGGSDLSLLADVLTWHPGMIKFDSSKPHGKGFHFKSDARSADCTSNATTNTFQMTTGGLSKASRFKYEGTNANRTAAQEQMFQRLQSGGQFSKTESGWVANIKVEYKKDTFLIINRKTDFSQLSSAWLSKNNLSGLLSLDGGLENREGVIVDIESYRDIYRRFHDVAHLPDSQHDVLDHLIALTRENIPLAETPEDKMLLDLEAFSVNSGSKIKLESGREIPCIPLDTFSIGNCRHLVLDLAVSIGILIQQKKLSPGPVNVFRYVAYNQQAHAWIMYQPSERELYLIDPTLPQGANKFNIRTPKGLIAAIEAYNAIGLNGLLADVIEHYHLHNIIDEKVYNELFDVKSINPAVAEQFDEDKDFAFARSYLSDMVASNPVRILFEDTVKGKTQVSEEVYDKAEIKAYKKAQKSNPHYTVTDTFDPAGSQRKIVKLIPDYEVKQKMLSLIVKKSMVANPEEFSGGLFKCESSQRGTLRFESAVQKAHNVLGDLVLSSQFLPAQKISEIGEEKRALFSSACDDLTTGNTTLLVQDDSSDVASRQSTDHQQKQQKAERQESRNERRPVNLYSNSAQDLSSLFWGGIDLLFTRKKDTGKPSNPSKNERPAQPYSSISRNSSTTFTRSTPSSTVKVTPLQDNKEPKNSF